QGNLFGEPEPLKAEPRQDKKATGEQKPPTDPASNEDEGTERYKAGDVIEFD
ncbi:MAG: hypothetical protein RL742_813, partial [Bacteroidota bacterium]